MIRDNMLQISSDVFRWIDIRDVISFLHYVLVSLCIFFCILYLYFCVYFVYNVYDFVLNKLNDVNISIN